jgi:hypothetical protein
VLSAARLFAVTDADQDAQPNTFQQKTTDPNSGHSEVNHVPQAPNTLINLANDQLANTSFVG